VAVTTLNISTMTRMGGLSHPKNVIFPTLQNPDGGNFHPMISELSYQHSNTEINTTMSANSIIHILLPCSILVTEAVN
jgi:hypothetical protein